MTKKTRKKMVKTKIKMIFNFFTIILVSAMVGGGFGYYLAKNFFEDRIEKMELNVSNDLKQPQQSLIQEDQAVVQVVGKNSPAVVSISITKEISQIDSFFSDPFLKQFYFGFEGDADSETETQEIGGGTGFVVDPNGYIITNKHVVDDSDAHYTVILDNGESYEAKVLAKDSFLDVAVLKVEEKNLPTVSLGNSDNLNIGQTVIAIGNSLGEFNNSVSKGIISGLKRQIEAGNSFGKTETLDEVIQTDAAINSGNSGGPLFDLNGKVIGINVAMAQGAENIGFTIPINQIKDIYQSVKNNGRIIRPYLGVRYVLINEQIQEMNNLLVNYGAIIIRGNERKEVAVIPGSPADKAGLKEYDIILEIDGEEINSQNTLAKIIRKKKIDQEITLKILSKGTEKTVKVVLKESDY